MNSFLILRCQIAVQDEVNFPDNLSSHSANPRRCDPYDFGQRICRLCVLHVIPTLCAGIKTYS
jgi:hypothetical protein